MSDHTDVDDGYDTDPDPTAGPTQYLQPRPHENHHHQLASDGSSDKPHSLHRIQPTPVPYRAVLALAASRVMEGIIWSSILPYINAFIRDIGVPKHQVGVWSAASESALNACEALSAPFYVAPANRFGRRPVLLVCIAGFGIFAAGFGLVKDLVGIIAMRGALGTMAGAGMVSRTMLGEVCDGTNRVKCFSIFSPALIVGTTIGPVIGGFLAKPVPRLLDPTWKLFVEFPYLLPALVCGLCGLISFLFGLAFIPETLPPSLRRLKRRQRNQRRHSRAHSTSTSISAGPARAARKTSERDALLTPDRAARVSRYGTSSSTSPNTNNSAVYGDEDEDESSEMSDVGSVLTAHSRLSTPAISRTRSKSNANNASKARRCSRTSTTTGTAGGDRHRRPSEALSIGSKLSIVSDVSEDAQANVSLWRLMKHGPYRRNLILFALSSGLMLSFEAILPLFAYTAPDLGGLGLSVETIGKILAVSAIVSVGMTLFVHPYLHRVMPERWYLFMCLSAWPIAILAFPLLWLTAHGFSQGPTPPPQGHDNALSAGIVFWLCVHIVARRIGDLGVTLLDTNIIANVPSPAYNALANSAAFTAASTSAGLTPLVLSYMFSLSTLSPSHSIGRQAVWIVFALGNLPGLYGAWTAY